MANKIVIYDSRVDSLFQPRGVVWDEIVQIGRETKAEATLRAPVNKNGVSQGLKFKHNIRTIPLGRRRGQTQIENTADYAAFVHEGTMGPITRPNGGLMTVGASAQRIFALSEVVAGQDANPWLEDSAVAVVRRRGLVR